MVSCLYIYIEEIANPTTMRSSSGTFLPGSVGACLEHRNFTGIAQKFYRNRFIFTGKTQEQEKIPAFQIGL
jgi:hypothetical protein